MKKRIYLTFVLACLPSLLYAESTQQLDALSWLQKMAAAAKQLTYSGTFIYQNGNRIETSRIVHLWDETGEHEHVETLDQAPREIIRNNDEVFCYSPTSNGLVVEKRKPRKSFPNLLPKQLQDVTENYFIKLGGRERIGGYECQVVILEPKDNLRYGYKFWAEGNTGLIIRASMMNEKTEIVDQYTFTQLVLGGPVDKEQFKPKEGATQIAPNIIDTTETPWLVKQPTGFKKVSEVKRKMAGRDVPVHHLVFSDGMAAISVFVESVTDARLSSPVLTKQGAVNVYTKPLAKGVATVLGEAPPVTLMQIANSIAPKVK